MTRYLRYLKLTETWRGRKTDRHVIDRFNEAYDIVFDSDDYIPDPDAIAEFARAASKGDYDLIYCDEDLVLDNRRTKPYFKPAYSPENERSLGHISGMTALKKGLNPDKLDGFSRHKVCHIPKVLYHRSKERRRSDPEKPDLFFDSFHGKISIVILSKDHPDMLEKCVSSISDSLISDDVEVILVDNGSSDGAKRRYEEISRAFGIRYLYSPEEFNYSDLNNYGASMAKGDILIFMNDDVIIPRSEKGILEKMAARADGEDAGAVGIKLLYPGEERIQHCGIVLLHSGPSNKLQGYKDDSYYFGYSDHDINTIAVTGACLAVSRDRFEQLGGFDTRLPVAYNDVDLCIRLYKKRLNNICINSRHLIHFEGATRADDTKDRASYERLKNERLYFTAKHGDITDGGDPYINKNLSPYRLDFDLNLSSEWELMGMSEVLPLNGRLRNKKHVHANLDSFEYRLSDAYGNEDFYEVTGWIFTELPSDLKPCAVIECEGRKIVAEGFEVKRSDVGEAFPRFKKSASSGFIARIPAEDTEKYDIKGSILIRPALMDGKGRVYTGDEECQKNAEI